MKTRYKLIIVCTLLVLAGWIINTSAPPTLAGTSVSEHYRLIISGIGNVTAAMQSATYILNEGVAAQFEVVPPMKSERYSVGGIILPEIYLPLVLKNQ